MVIIKNIISILVQQNLTCKRMNAASDQKQKLELEPQTSTIHHKDHNTL